MKQTFPPAYRLLSRWWLDDYAGAIHVAGSSPDDASYFSSPSICTLDLAGIATGGRREGCPADP